MHNNLLIVSVQQQVIVFNHAGVEGNGERGVRVGVLLFRIIQNLQICITLYFIRCFDASLSVVTVKNAL